MFGRGKKGGGAVDLGKQDVVPAAEVRDDLGPYPEDVDATPSKARGQERALRAVSIVAVVSAMMNIAQIMLLLTLFPLQKVYPYLITFKSQDQQVVSVEPVAINAPGMLYATEDNVRDYVTQRHSFTPIKATMEEQWGINGRLAARTTPDLYERFAKSSVTDTQQMLQSGVSRTIQIKSVQRISGSESGDTWRVDFRTNDTVPGSTGGLQNDRAFQDGTTGTVGADGTMVGTGNATIASVTPTSTRDWVATLRVSYVPQNVTYDKRLLNPLGFTVTDYSVTSANGR